MNRRDFLTAFVPSSDKKAAVLRPPYTDEGTEYGVCRECSAPCVKECETGVLVMDEEGYPSLSFSKTGCTYCEKCAEACPEGVISKEKTERIRAEVVINPNRCSAWNGVLCFSCKEPCLDNAIRFEGLYKPVVVAGRCTACGFCVSVCPTGAIEVRARHA
ncbi:ferredoxin-type protein NapF [Hydrogenivirga sp.]